MNKIEEIRDNKASEYVTGELSMSNVWRSNLKHKSFSDGFDVAMELQLPVKFSKWKDSTCIEHFNGKNTSYYIGHFSNTKYSIKQLFNYWLENVYKP